MLDLPSAAGAGIMLRFGRQVGRGASGAVVHKCTLVPAGCTNNMPKQKSRQTPSGSAFAAKILPLSPSIDTETVRDFGREVAIMREASYHPALVGFLGAWSLGCSDSLDSVVGGVEKAYVLCIELCDASLDSVARHRKEHQAPFESSELSPTLAQIASGVAHLHQCGILHRDIKAANVLLQRRDEDGHSPEDSILDWSLSRLTAKLGDMGVAKCARRAQTPVQTPQWMAPEAMRLDGYGQEADVWGFGALTHELLELGPPFGEDITLQQLEESLLAGRGPQLSDREGTKLRAPGLVEVMDACLAIEPSKRPSADEVARQLASL